MLSADEKKFLQDVEDSKKMPKWVESFRQKVLNDSRLPFLLIYNAVGIGLGSSKNKSASIAIATSNLQRSGSLLIGTNSLSARGDLRERAVLKSLGKRVAKEYLSAFESL